MKNFKKPSRKDHPEGRIPPCLLLTLKAGMIPIFFQLLQKGFVVKTKVGCSIMTLLCEQLDLSPEYLEKNIQTIFLDSKPVDDLDTTIIRDGSVLALSAAMPGLLGAMLRRGSYYAQMRSEISHRDEIKSMPLQEGRVIVKLFNLLIPELGPTFFERGIWINTEDLQEFLKKHLNDFQAGLKNIRVDDEEYDIEKLSKMEWESGEVFLKLKGVS